MPKFVSNRASKILMCAKSKGCHCMSATNDEQGSPLIASRVNAQTSLRSSRAYG